MVKRLLLTVLLVGAGCGGTPKGTVVVDFDEFTVKAKPASVSAGRVRFDQRNNGALEHELVVIKTELAPDDLPLRKVDVDLSAATLDVAVRDRRLGPADNRTISARLGRGDYVLVCNVPGHYQSGMHAPFVVR